MYRLNFSSLVILFWKWTEMFLGYFYTKKAFLIMNTINAQGDLADISSETATLPTTQQEPVRSTFWAINMEWRMLQSLRKNIGWLLSQAPTNLMLLAKTLPDLLKLQKIGNSTLTCSNSLWHFRTRRFFPVGPWWGGGHKDCAKMIFEGQ